MATLEIGAALWFAASALSTMFIRAASWRAS